MIEIKNYDGVLVAIPFWKINMIVSDSSGQSCTIYLDNEDVVFCTESRSTVVARFNKYLNDNKPFALHV